MWTKPLQGPLCEARGRRKLPTILGSSREVLCTFGMTGALHLAQMWRALEKRTKICLLKKYWGLSWTPVFFFLRSLWSCIIFLWIGLRKYLDYLPLCPLKCCCNCLNVANVSPNNSIWSISAVCTVNSMRNAVAKMWWYCVHSLFHSVAWVLCLCSQQHIKQLQVYVQLWSLLQSSFYCANSTAL